MGWQRIRQNRMTEHQQPWSFTICATEIPTVFARQCAFQLLIRVQLFAALWTVAPRSSILYGIFQARILKWVAISSSRGSCPPRDWTQVSCTSYIGWWVLFCWTTWETSQYITGYPEGLNLESGTQDILTGDVNIQSYVIIAHMIMEWPCSQRRKNSLSKSN